MNITRANAIAMGYTIDDHCNPPVAYKGARFNPTAWVSTYTERETILIDTIVSAITLCEDVESPFGAADVMRTGLDSAGVSAEES